MVTYTLLINGQELDRSYPLISMMIHHEVNQVPFARCVFRDAHASERNFELSDGNVFVPGNKVQVKVGRGRSTIALFQGIIVKIGVQLAADGNAQLQVECRHDAVKMTLGRHSRNFANVKDSEVIDQLIAGYAGLKSDLQATNLNHKAMVQYRLSDWDFIGLRAEANGMLVFVEGETIKVAKPDTSTRPVLALRYGESILDFKAEMDAMSQWKKVSATSWDYGNQQLNYAETSEAAAFKEWGNIPSSKLAEAIDLENYTLTHSAHLEEQELQDWVDGSMLRSRLAKTRGKAKIIGVGKVKPGDLVKLSGVGERFGGNAYVTAVRHEVGNGTWETHIQFGLDPEPYMRKHPELHESSSAGLLGAIRGLQPGKVVQLGHDPDGEDRILVKLPLMDEQAPGIWTRVASLDAGANRGAFFLPDIGDEVVVGFVNDDPRHAVVLGMLNSSAKPAPQQADDSNHRKGFTTRSGLKLDFDDDTKTVSIDTPAGNRLELDEQGSKIELQDQNDNKIIMDANGIKMQSLQGIEINSAGNVIIQGLNLSVKANNTVTIEGASTKLSASGVVEVKGSLVKIN